jgi:glycerol-1-phosphate dehydrogenase [NAD(P)+]
MKIPRYIFISEKRRETKDCFLQIFKDEKPEKIVIVTSHSLEKRSRWLLDFVRKESGSVKKLIIEGSGRKALENTRKGIRAENADFCIGIGGGKILDIAKYASYSEKIRFLSFPTLLSHDGIASPVAVIRDGKHWSESRRAKSPCAVIVDLKTVGSASSESLLSGIGDLTANLFASLDAEVFKEKNKKTYNELAVNIGRSASLLVFPRFSEVAIEKISTKDLKHLSWGLILSGISMAIAGNSFPASGAEHKISHGIDYVFDHPYHHGYTVSLGSVLSAFLHKKYRKEIIDFNHSLGLPIEHDDIGLERDAFIEAILYASTIRPDRYTVLEEKRLTRRRIIILLDKIRRERKDKERRENGTR